MSSPDLPYAISLPHCDPADWVARLAHADELEERSRLSQSYLARSRAWLWAWLCETQAAFRLRLVNGRGTDVKCAVFSLDVDSPPNPKTDLTLCWNCDDYDLPGDWGNGDVQEAGAGEEPWLRSGRIREFSDFLEPLPPVFRGASVLEFCAAIERAGGWWYPGELCAGL